MGRRGLGCIVQALREVGDQMERDERGKVGYDALDVLVGEGTRGLPTADLVEAWVFPGAGNGGGGRDRLLIDRGRGTGVDLGLGGDAQWRGGPRSHRHLGEEAPGGSCSQRSSWRVQTSNNWRTDEDGRYPS